MNTRAAAGALLAAVVLTAVSGCTGDDAEPSAASSPPAAEAVTPTSTPATPAEPPIALGPLGETDAEFETDEGGFAIGDAEVPALVAAGFPLTDDLDVQLASESTGAAGFNGVSQIPFDELVEFYASALPAAGYTASRTQFVDGVVAVFEFDGPDGNGEVVVASAPGGGRSVIVTFSS